MPTASVRGRCGCPSTASKEQGIEARADTIRLVAPHRGRYDLCTVASRSCSRSAPSSAGKLASPRTSSSSLVSSSLPSFSARKRLPTMRAAIAHRQHWKEWTTWGRATARRRSRPAASAVPRSRRCATSRSPSVHWTSRRCSSAVMPELVKSHGLTGLVYGRYEAVPRDGQRVGALQGLVQHRRGQASR